MLITQSQLDRKTLRDLVDAGLPAPDEQPPTYDGFVVLKPWGYELQLYANEDISVWLACLKPGAEVSMHCHQNKRASFIPFSNSLVLNALPAMSYPLDNVITVERGVFHSQANLGTSDAFFLEYEWPNEKTDLVRYRDKYGRVGKGYEGHNSMVPIEQLPELRSRMPLNIQHLVEKVAMHA